MKDVVEMRQFSGNVDYEEASGNSTGGVAQYSPDGSRFVFLLRKGNLGEDTNEYSLTLWSAKELFSSPVPIFLVSMASSSNRPAIEQIKWLGNQALLFLGERPGELHQLYRFNLATQALAQLTHSPTNVLSYDYNGLARQVVYFAEKPRVRELFDGKARTNGLVVTTQDPVSLASGEAEPSKTVELLAQPLNDRGFQSTRTIQRAVPAVLDGDLFISPDGRYVAAKVHFEQPPETWAEYRDEYGDFIGKIVRARVEPGEYSSLYQYQLIDLVTGKRQWLLDSPIWGRDSFAWAADSRSALICGTYLPLTAISNEDRKARVKNTYCAEVGIADGSLRKVAADYGLRFKAWEQKTGDLLFYANVTKYFKVPIAGAPVVRYHKIKGVWLRVSGPTSLADSARPSITLREGMTMPPHLVAEDLVNHRVVDLLDLNPQFKKLKFGKEELLTYTDKRGHTWTGGLYYPVNYRAGTRYPLVIQTHEFNPNKFWINGPYATSYAAQPLAGRDMFVLQLETYEAAILEVTGSLNEVKDRTTEYEGAIDELDRRGMIDRQRVGIMGFSRTCWYVKYMLTHSQYHIAAASVADGIDGGYIQDILFGSAFGSADGVIYGGPFWSTARELWLREAPGFSLDKVRTPLFIFGPRMSEAIAEAEWFSGLRRLKKPVDFVLLEDGAHPVERPSEIRVSEESNVDWFDFWLDAHEDSDDAKVGQYRRWEKLCDMQVTQNPAQPAFCVHTKPH